MNNRHGRLDVFKHNGTDVEARLAEIIERKLDARNIDTYADQALDDLIELVEFVVAKYDYQFVFSHLENERQALINAEMDPDTVESTLDHIAAVAETIRRLDAIIDEKTTYLDDVLVPPDKHLTIDFVPGEGSAARQKEKIPKLKTLLLLLETEFGINLEDPEDLPEIMAGPVLHNMVRTTSYRLVQVPRLSRGVLICDEMDNTTFVFDQQKCDELDITPEDLYRMTKDEQKELIDELGVGVRIDYSDGYVDRLAKALGKPLESFDNPDKAGSVSILKPKKKVLSYIPEGYATALEMKDRLDITLAGVDSRVASIDSDCFGEVLFYRPSKFVGASCRIFSPEQQELMEAIGDPIEQIVDHIPEGYVIFDDFAHSLGLGKTGLDRRAATISAEVFGPIIRYRRRNLPGQPIRILSPTQQALLREGYGSILDHIPEGFIAVLDMASELGLTMAGLDRRIKKISSEEFGEIKMCIKKGQNTTRTRILSPDQQGLLRAQDLQMKNRRGRAVVLSSAID